MGVVWRARDELLSRDVAIKEIIWPSHLDGAERDIARRRALREAQMAARLSHPNVVSIYDIVEEDDRPWLVMELVRCRSLRDVIVSAGPLPPPQAARVGLGILAALRAAHAAGVLHRDVKPANVLLAPKGRVVLTDFGIARAADSPALTGTGILVGSPSYIAPERARGEDATAPGDMWGLGACLYAAVEGRPPFEREGALASLTAVVTDEPDPPRRAGPLWPVISGLLRKDPGSRLDADEVEQMLHRIGDTARGGSAEPSPGPVPVARGRRRLAARVRAGRPGAAAAAPDPAAPGTASADAGPAAAGSAPAGSHPDTRKPPAASPPVTPERRAAVFVPAQGGPPTGPGPGTAAGEPIGPIPAVPGQPRSPWEAPETRATARTGATAGAREMAGTGATARTGKTAGTRETAGTLAATELGAAPQAPPLAAAGHTGPAAHRRSRSALAAAVALAAGAAAAALALAGSPHHRVTASTAPSRPARTTPATRSASAPPAPSPSATAPSQPASTSGGSTGTLPAGYHRFTNSTGFSIGVPAGWRISHVGHYVVVQDPASSGIFLLIDQSDQPQPNALADWQQQAAARQASFPGYHLIRLQAVSYPQAEQAADWDFTYDRGGVEVHILNRNVLANARHAYALYWSVPEAQWTADYHYFQAFAATFRPASVNQG